MHTVLGSFFDEDRSLEEAGKSAAIRLKVPVLDPKRSVEEQLPKVKVALDAAGRLLDWVLQYANVWIAHLEKA